MRPSNAELMSRVQAGDAQAFSVLYDRLSPGAMRVAAWICDDRDRACDVVQEAFIAIWRTRATYDPDRGAPAAWAMGIVRNRAMDLMRGHRRHDLRCDGTEGVLHRLASSNDLETWAGAQAEADRLRALLIELPDAQRDVIALAYFGQLSHTEIADRLAVPVGTVKGRMRLGLSRLHARLAA